jgi:hypothetical protein
MSLPPCHSRRELPTTPGEIYCVHPQVHVNGCRVRTEICNMCDNWRQPEPATFKPFPPPPPRGQCFHLGEVTGERLCATCRGNVRLKVFACSHPAHTETTWDECKRCPDHQEAAASVEGSENA